MALQPGPKDTVVLVDDFSGTGNQACDGWNEIFQELLPLRPRVLLVLLAMSSAARDRVTTEPAWKGVPTSNWAQMRTSSPANALYSPTKRRLGYFTTGQRADPEQPRDGMIADSSSFSRTLLRTTRFQYCIATKGALEGLFPRYD